MCSEDETPKTEPIFRDANWTDAALMIGVVVVIALLVYFTGGK